MWTTVGRCPPIRLARVDAHSWREGYSDRIFFTQYLSRAHAAKRLAEHLPSDMKSPSKRLAARFIGDNCPPAAGLPMTCAPISRSWPLVLPLSSSPRTNSGPEDRSSLPIPPASTQPIIEDLGSGRLLFRGAILKPPTSTRVACPSDVSGVATNSPRRFSIPDSKRCAVRNFPSLVLRRGSFAALNASGSNGSCLTQTSTASPFGKRCAARSCLRPRNSMLVARVKRNPTHAAMPSSGRSTHAIGSAGVCSWGYRKARGATTTKARSAAFVGPSGRCHANSARRLSLRSIPKAGMRFS
jgi:hypothetical protein